MLLELQSQRIMDEFGGCATEIRICSVLVRKQAKGTLFVIVACTENAYVDKYVMGKSHGEKKLKNITET